MQTETTDRGFTLLELMVVLVILAILGGIAYSSFRAQVMRAKRSEAILGLQGIFQAQSIYKGATMHYGDTFDEIGFELDGATRVDERTIQGKVYTFTVQAIPAAGNPKGSFQALATGDLDAGDSMLDILMVENYLPTP